MESYVYTILVVVIHFVTFVTGLSPIPNSSHSSHLFKAIPSKDFVVGQRLCREGGQGSWVQDSEPRVPLVPFGWNSITGRNGSYLAFNGRGLLYDNNGQDHKRILRLQRPSLLKFLWRPKDCELRNLSKSEVKTMLRGLWVHFDGDSLARDTYYDFLEALDVQGFLRSKVHVDQRLVAEGSNTLVTFGWNPSHGKGCITDVSWEGRGNGRLAPDVWIYTTGVWDLRWKTRGRTFVQRVECTLKLKPNNTLGIVRLNTIYLNTAHLHSMIEVSKGNPRLVAFNGLTLNLIAQYNANVGPFYLRQWHAMDPVPLVEPRPELSTDGLHYTGVGSRWFTLVLLNLVHTCDMLCTDRPMSNWTAEMRSSGNLPKLMALR